MNPIHGHHLITPDELHWRPSNLMKIPNADYLERTGSENLGARLWRLPPWSANTLHKHVRAEEFYFVLEGVGRMRVDDATLTVPRYGAVLVRPASLRQVFNDTDEEVLWLIIGGPEELEFLQGSKSKVDLSLFYPVDPTRLPPALQGRVWPPADGGTDAPRAPLPALDFPRFTQEWLEAWNAHDLERILSHYAQDVEFHSPFIEKILGKPDGRLQGKAALREYFSHALRAYPALKFEFSRVYGGGRSCVLEYRSVNGIRAAECMEFDGHSTIRRVQAHYLSG